MEVVLTDQFQQFLAADTVLDESQFHHIHVTEVVERMVLVIDVGHTATHTGCEVTARLTEHHHATTSHIFTAVIASALDDGDGT